MSKTVYEVWQTKHHPDKKTIDPEHERLDASTNYDQALGTARTAATRALNREEKRRGDDEVVTDLYNEEHEWDEPDAAPAREDLPVGQDDTRRFKTVIKYETGGDTVTITKPIWTYYIVQTEVTDA